MSNIRQVLSDKDMGSKEKLATIAIIVTEARKDYGNTGADIPTAKANTTNGMVDYKFLSDDDKVAVIEQEVSKIVTQATEVVENTAGASLDSEISRLIAVNPFMANVAVSTGSKYI